MKILTLTVLLTTLIFMRSHAQENYIGFTYHDAISFESQVEKASNADPTYMAKIIGYYFDKKDLTPGNIIATIEQSDNPFFKDKVLLDKIRAAVKGKRIDGGAQAVDGGIVGSFQNDLIVGATDWLIKRGKKELSMAFFQSLKNDLRKYPELRYLFPETYGVIDNVEAHNILNLLPELQDAFKKDILSEAKNILSLSKISDADCLGNDEKCKARIKKVQDVMKNIPLVLSLNVIQNIGDGNSVLTTLDKVIHDDTICSTDVEYVNYLKLTFILLDAMRADGETDGMFINGDKIKNLYSSVQRLNIFFGLIYQKQLRDNCYNKLKIGNSDLKKVFSDIITNHNKFAAAISSFDNINVAYKAIKNKIALGEVVDNSLYVAFAAASIKAIPKVIDGYNASVPGSGTSTELRLILKNMDTGADLVVNIQQQNYPGIFNGCIKIINDNKVFAEETLHRKVISYLSFAANLSSAKSPEQIENAIEAMALPPGSYTVKQKSSYNISLNGYIGYSADFSSGNLFAHGFYAPIGLSFSKGLGRKHQWALTLFSSIVDLGGVVSYRIKDSETQSLKQEVRLESIISPSAQLMIGIPKTPVAFGAGWRMSPKLFYNNDQTFTSVRARSVFNLSAVIDIPIFTLFNRTYN